MGSTFRHFFVGFALVAGGIMVANGLWSAVTPTAWVAYPGRVVVCLVPAYWYGHRIGAVSYSLWDILGTVVAVVAAVGVFKLWAIVNPVSAMTLAGLVCLFFLFRRRALPRTRGARSNAQANHAPAGRR